MSKNANRLSLGQRLRQARREKGLSQQALAVALNVTDKAISAYEVDRTEPTLATLRLICKATAKPIGYFLDDDANFDAVAIASKLMTVEREIQEVKKILEKMTSQA